MNTLLIPAASRGHTDHGWLNAHHTFSFGNYYDPARMGFGVLRVINDDQISAGKGFGTHPHDNMEIITIPLSGTLAHKDSMNHQSLITPGEVQVMSAGTGITHSEFNASPTEALKLLQIWVMTKTPNVTPRYDQRRFDWRIPTIWIPIVRSLDSESESYPEALGIHQDVQFCMGTIPAGKSLDYTLLYPKNGVFSMVVSGDVLLAGQALHARDGIGIMGAQVLNYQAVTDAQVLVMEVPM